ncbi:hypothetical protein C4565_03210 [Candidatus Parcubacteria bacterium]|nr:MAG: hypothetical protein C4565_03210 [Candidatus Parcubacteria bacterium]
MDIFPSFVIIPICYFLVFSLVILFFWYQKTHSSGREHIVTHILYKFFLVVWVLILFWLYTALGIFIIE